MSEIQNVMVPLDWKPPWAPEHIKANYTQLVLDDDGEVDEPQIVKCKCERCGADFERKCYSGNAREHIQRFARVHFHDDTLKV